MNQRFQSSESLLGLLESGIFLTFLLLIVVVGCDSKETAVSDYPSGATSVSYTHLTLPTKRIV